LATLAEMAGAEFNVSVGYFGGVRGVAAKADLAPGTVFLTLPERSCLTSAHRPPPSWRDDAESCHDLWVGLAGRPHSKYLWERMLPTTPYLRLLVA
jgi:hypothetical protein